MPNMHMSASLVRAMCGTAHVRELHRTRTRTRAWLRRDLDWIQSSNDVVEIAYAGLGLARACLASNCLRALLVHALLACLACACLACACY
eukprot:341212-Chlamydomonas_euryale.AAC.2